MKKLSLALALLFSVTTASAATITLDFSTLTPTAGSNFTAAVYLSNAFAPPVAGDEIIGFGFDVFSGNNTVLSFVNATIAPLFTSAGAAGADVSAFTVDPSLAAGSFVEPLLLATLTFQANNAGTTNAGVLTDLITPNPDHGLFYLGNTLAINASQSIDVFAAPVGIPEPSTFVLLSGALAALAALRRKR